MKRHSPCLVLAALLATGVSIVAQQRITFDEARPVFDALGANLPAEFRDRPLQVVRGEWGDWLARHDRDVRARLARGDEDSVVNFWLYGTSFTTHPPAAATRTAAASADDLTARRLDDFLDGVRAPGANERLRFARELLVARQADPSTTEGRAAARTWLLETRRRMIDEFAATDRALAAAGRAGGGAATTAAATVFRARGLSTDTSILSGYSVSVALDAVAKQQLLLPAGVVRAAVVGPGLDFTNKADGYDFYPEQSIQPFALVDTLRRLRLAAPALRVTAFDVSERVNRHFQAARARTGPYVLTLPLDGGEKWMPPLVAYWKAAGRAIGDDLRAPRPPDAAGDVMVRAVRVRDDVVQAIDPRALDVVVDRLPLAPGERFDLVVATNVLVYYDVFEQALALANIASMLRPGGVLLTNSAALPSPPLSPSATYLRVQHTPERYDEMFWYVRDR